MTTTLSAMAAVCLLSLTFILIIPHFAATKVLMRFLPRDIREAAKAHPDPSVGRQVIGYLITGVAAAGYAGLLFFLGAVTASGCCLGATCCFCMATSCSIFWCRINTS